MLANVIHNPDRDRNFKKELENIPYVVWPAIFEKKPCTGVSKAHKQIVQWAKELNLPEVLVMEDDIKFTHPLSFQFFLSQKPPTFNIYFGGVYRGTIKDGFVTHFSGMHCYIVQQHFYDAFLSAHESKDIDNWLSEQPYKYHICYPMAAIQYNGYSDVNRKVSNYDNLLIGKELFSGLTLI